MDVRPFSPEILPVRFVEYRGNAFLHLKLRIFEKLIHEIVHVPRVAEADDPAARNENWQERAAEPLLDLAALVFCCSVLLRHYIVKNDDVRAAREDRAEESHRLNRRVAHGNLVPRYDDGFRRPVLVALLTCATARHHTDPVPIKYF